MTPDFVPLFRNPHIATIAGNYWHRAIDTRCFPEKRVAYQVAPTVTVVALENSPTAHQLRGHVVLLHGLEGSANGGYMVSFAQKALTLGFAVHRLNMRSCGGTEELSDTMYHSGLTADALHVIRSIRARNDGPVFLVGFSLGGNVALKLAGELRRSELINAVCAVSTPIDLACAVRAIDKPGNIIYARRFLSRLKDRVRRKNTSLPDLYPVAGLNQIRTIFAFDDRYTAPLFGFGTAGNYYATQSAARFLQYIEIPTLLVTAQDDPLVPFEMYSHKALQNNPALTLVAPKYGGHLGFLSKRQPRFWLDEFVSSWLQQIVSRNNSVRGLVHPH